MVKKDKYMKGSILIVVLMACLNIMAYSQDAAPDMGDGVPTVFILGEFQESYHALGEVHRMPLLSACGDDMNLAYEKWLDMVQSMENFSSQIDYDLKGVKMWLQLYWNADGSINHIAYFLKPNSRNVPYEDLSAFFKSFTKTYQLPISSTEGFSHYGSVSFPLFGIPNPDKN